jgi:homoserine dehydrogenase
MRFLLLSILATTTTNVVAFAPFVHHDTPRLSITALHASTTTNAEKPIQLGIFGGGTVGGGIVEILEKKRNYLQRLTGTCLQVKSICVRDADKERDFGIPEGCDITTNYDDILQNDDIDIVVEVMGGVDEAKDIVYRALEAGKNVVTANKALIAKHLPDIEAILEKVNANRDIPVEFRYEAAVCGGIPVIRSMQSDFVGDEISKISGIINGCTNFMLTSMDKGGKTYDEALAEAAELGYAEADPTLDVGGFDARSKLRILMRLAYGVEVDEEAISCRGITDLTKLDFEYAKMMGGTIKLLGVSQKVGEDRVAAFVSPCYVTGDDSLASVNGATNAVEVLSSNLQSSTYIGQGAGRFPTANSCVNDIIALAKGDQTPLPFNPDSEKLFVDDYDSVFYVRLCYRDALGITRQCGEICEKHGVSIHSILQNPVTKRDDAAFVIITEKVPLTSVEAVAADLAKLDWCKETPFVMPVLNENWVETMND